MELTTQDAATPTAAADTTTPPSTGGRLLPLQRVSAETMAKKYLHDGETTEAQCHRRVALAIAAAEATEEGRAHWADRFIEAFEAGMSGGGRIMAGAGRNLLVTLINCFTNPVGDCMRGVDENGRPGIADALSEAVETLRRGGGEGYNFTSIRPKGAWVRGTNSHASGPLPFIDLFDSACKTVESAGARRGAQMGIVNIDHPDVEAFIVAKRDPERWKNFNVTVAVYDAFIDAVRNGGTWELVHEKQPHPEAVPDAYQRDSDGKWVYRTIEARALWDLILDTTYEVAEPGIFFIDRVNRENNLWYCEYLWATNPCGEQILPDYGCCNLASHNLTRYVRRPFTREATFDYAAFATQVATTVRFLDNVLDVTVWPLPQQQVEAANKRRTGQGFYGLGSAMMMLGIRYGSDASVQFAESIARALRDHAYRASIELAKERGAFPLFDADKYLQSGFARRLPEDIREDIRRHGIRNSHLLSIAPTGTMALAFGDNASNGIEPAFSLSYQRRIRQPDDTFVIDDVEDHAWRVYKHLGGDTENLPDAIVTTRDLTPEDHLRVMAVVQHYVDSSISKTINCPADMPREVFGDVYMRAFELGCKSVTTYRPSKTRGAVLIDPDAAKAGEPENNPDRRLVLKPAAGLTEGALRWPREPTLPDGAESWTMRVNAPSGRFAVTVPHVTNGVSHPFAVWVQGAEAPRGLTAIAKVLSRDMRTNDPAWLSYKLRALAKAGGAPFELAMPPTGRPLLVGSPAAAVGHLVRYRAEKLGYLTDTLGESPMLLAMASIKEPKTRGQGSLAWYADVSNPATDDDLVIWVKEAVLEDGRKFPFSIWASGEYPGEWNGLFKLLSLDMRISDPRWIAAKLRDLVDHPEAKGDFLAPVPGGEGMTSYASTISYIAALLLHRYRELGILDEAGEPIRQAGLFATEVAIEPTLQIAAPASGRGHKDCGECGAVRSVIKRDGCSHCEHCGWIGSCG